METRRQYLQLRKEVEQDIRRYESTQSRATSISADDEAKKDDEDVEKTPRQETSSVEGVEIKTNGDEARLVVSWKENDPSNPYNWPMTKKWTTMVTCSSLAISLTQVSSVEGPTVDAFDAYYGVGPLAGSFATTGIFLIGIGIGSLFAGPFSETFGRNAVYTATMILVMLFVMAKALAPNFGAALVFRFISAIFAAAPMTVAGGTIGDVWTPLQLSFGLPFTMISAYVGPVIGPVIGAYTPLIGFQWADWISMILLGFTLIIVLLFQPETYGPTLLEWRAKHLRDVTGDSRYCTEHQSLGGLPQRLLTNSTRPFTMVWTEPIILVFSFYLTLIYFVLFTFLTGYPYIFTMPYGLDNGITYILFVAMIPGVAVAAALIPLMYHFTKKAARRAAELDQPLPPEVSLYWGMAGSSFLMPISLFWMAWTCYSSISIWSPIIASFVFGYSLVCLFTTSYMYIIFVYGQYAASALGFLTFTRYVISGTLIPASVKMYDNIGPHWSLTISAVVATLMAPVPFILYRYGHKVRALSKFAQARN